MRGGRDGGRNTTHQLLLAMATIPDKQHRMEEDNWHIICKIKIEKKIKKAKEPPDVINAWRLTRWMEEIPSTCTSLLLHRGVPQRKSGEHLMG